MRGRSTSGLSLVEVLVAIAMLGIISASIVAFLPTIVTVNREANTEQQVTAASKAFFEDLSALDAPSALTDGNYAAGEPLPGVPVTVPQGCRAVVSTPVVELAVKRVVLACEGTVDQVLELGDDAP